MTQHQLHQTYKIIEQKESSTIVEYVVNKTRHRCSLLPIALEKEIILFHKGVCWNGELNLELSVLNYYQANRKEIFRVVEEKEKVLIITSNGLLNLAAPLRFKDHIMGNDLELMIDGLDLELNRLIFKSFVDEVPDYSIFEQGKVYDLPVTAVALFPNGKKYVSVSYLNQSFKMICPHAITTIKEGDKVDLYVTDVSAAGYLNLAAALIDWTNKNYDVQTVFQQINLGGKEEDFFFNLADQFKVLQAKDAFLIDYLEQYEANNNLWVFSYLSFLDQYIFILLAEQAHEQAQQVIQVYLNFEFWILNTSDYLTIFSKQKRENLIIKAENKLEQLTALQQVLQWYRNGEIEEKINLFHEQLLRNGYLNKEKAAQVVAIFMSIEYFRDEVITESSTALIELGLKKNIFSENDYWMIHLRLKKEIKKLKKRFLDTLMGEDSIESSQLKQLISFNLMVLKLGNRFVDRDKRIAVSVNLLRFLSYYKSEVNYLDLAQDLILSQ